MNQITLEKCFSGLFPLGVRSLALPTWLALYTSRSHGTILVPCYQTLAVMEADSWHRRVPKITQTAGQGGVRGPGSGLKIKITWNPVQTQPVVAS